MSRLELIGEQIAKARAYSASLLEDLNPDDWFAMPGSGVTHLAWQVGHLAAAEYYLTMVRIRGQKDEDASLIAPELLKLFGRGSTPDPDPGKYPPVEDILQVFHRVHAQAIDELRQLPDAVLDEPTDPHPMFTTKLGAVSFCPLHEMVHAGQIGLLRRLLGRAPLR